VCLDIDAGFTCYKLQHVSNRLVVHTPRNIDTAAPFHCLLHMNRTLAAFVLVYIEPLVTRYYIVIIELYTYILNVDPVYCLVLYLHTDIDSVSCVYK
jgi:hypothetical protein